MVPAQNFKIGWFWAPTQWNRLHMLNLNLETASTNSATHGILKLATPLISKKDLTVNGRGNIPWVFGIRRIGSFFSDRDFLLQRSLRSLWRLFCLFFSFLNPSFPAFRIYLIQSKICDQPNQVSIRPTGILMGQKIPQFFYFFSRELRSGVLA